MMSFCLSTTPTASLISNPKTPKPPLATSSSRLLHTSTNLIFPPRQKEVLTWNYYSKKSYQRGKSLVRMAPEEEQLTRRNPLDFPVEWDRPKPGRRPDIFPQFSPMKTPLPPPLPYDPPEEDEEEEEKEKKEEEEEDPEKEEPEQPE